MTYYVLTFWHHGMMDRIHYTHYPDLEELYRDLKHFTGSPFTDYILEEA